MIIIDKKLSEIQEGTYIKSNNFAWKSEKFISLHD